MRSALALNLFEVPWVKRRPSTVSFVAGQPLGYYSSWPLFALSHHIVVWWCAERVYPGVRFTKYAVLGDDVVIADSSVAKVYEANLHRLNVSISYQKSLISDSGGAEFAKRFRVKGLTKDLSPVSARSLCNFFHPYGLVAIGHKYKCARFSTLCRVGGMGYRQRSRLETRRSARAERLFVMWNKALFGHGCLELWLGRGLPLSPYLRGVIIQLLRKEMKPQDSKSRRTFFLLLGSKTSLSGQCFVHGCGNGCVIVIGTMVLDPWVSIEAFFDAPVVNVKWKADRKSVELVRFGLLWKILDLVGELGVSFRCPILDDSSGSERSGPWLLGGVDGTSFLVSPVGLFQPKAGKGVVVCGIVKDPSKPDPAYITVRYKTKRLADDRERSD